MYWNTRKCKKMVKPIVEFKKHTRIWLNFSTLNVTEGNHFNTFEAQCEKPGPSRWPCFQNNLFEWPCIIYCIIIIILQWRCSDSCCVFDQKSSFNELVGQLYAASKKQPCSKCVHVSSYQYPCKQMYWNVTSALTILIESCAQAAWKQNTLVYIFFVLCSCFLMIIFCRCLLFRTVKPQLSVLRKQTFFCI